MENSPLYVESMEKFFSRCVKEHIQIVTSTLTIEVVDIDAEIAEQGAKIRGQYKNFKAMDALQIAAAVSKKETSSFTRFPFLIVEDGA